MQLIINPKLEKTIKNSEIPPSQRASIEIAELIAIVVL